MIPFRKTKWVMDWRHPSGDFSSGYITGSYRTARAARRAAIRWLRGNEWPPPQSSYLVPISRTMSRIEQGTLEVERA